jgi:hypothetical protein
LRKPLILRTLALVPEDRCEGVLPNDSEAQPQLRQPQPAAQRDGGCFTRRRYRWSSLFVAQLGWMM